VQRLAHDLSFTLGAFLAGLFAGEFDVIYCCCPPPTLGLAAYVLGKIHRRPYVVKLADLASDAALATGILKDGWLVRLARGLESFVYRKAQKVVCLCQGFIDKLVSRGIPLEKLHLVPDWADSQRVYPIADATAFRRANNLSPEQFLVLHSGNMGKKQDLMNVVRAAEICRSRPEIVWLLVGNGEERALIAEEIRRRNIENIRLLPLQPAESLAEMYSAADVLLLNQKAAVQDAVIPSKLLTYMAAGRAVIAAVNERSEAARQVRVARCGLIAPAESPDALVRTVLEMRESAALRKEFGGNGRAYADLNFTKQKVLDEYEFIFNSYKGEKATDRKVSKEAAAVP
jgi:colanic acid biosynthesis glycosyl transferase WcaI